jgi:transposase-like protein
MNTKVEAGRPKVTMPKLSLDAFDRRFPDEDACKEYLVSLRWPDGVRCPRCGNEKVYKLSRPWSWQCQKCAPKGYRFSPLAGTVFQDTKYPLKVWFKVAYLMLSSKKGISALQLYRMFAPSAKSDYRTFWFMCHRIRAAMKSMAWEQLMGVVEVDETYLGGKDHNRHADKKRHVRGTGDKTPVIGAISRKGNLICRMIERADVPTIDGFVRKVVNTGKVDLIATDEHSGYMNLKPTGVPHETVNHRGGEYVRGVVHTNTVESFWALLKRGVIGTYHNVSREYLPLYLAEFSFRHNLRHEPDAFGRLISSVS